MKKIAIVLTLLISSSVHAGNYDFCLRLEAIAKQTMMTRQAGVSASVVYGAAKGDNLIMSIVKEAYKNPAYDTEKYQQQAVNEFKDEVFILCMEE